MLRWPMPARRPARPGPERLPVPSSKRSGLVGSAVIARDDIAELAHLLQPQLEFGDGSAQALLSVGRSE
jgi:hypothetical protein